MHEPLGGSAALVGSASLMEARRLCTEASMPLSAEYGKPENRAEPRVVNRGRLSLRRGCGVVWAALREVAQAGADALLRVTSSRHPPLSFCPKALPFPPVKHLSMAVLPSVACSAGLSAFISNSRT